MSSKPQIFCYIEAVLHSPVNEAVLNEQYLLAVAPVKYRHSNLADGSTRIKTMLILSTAKMIGAEKEEREL